MTRQIVGRRVSAEESAYGKIEGVVVAAALGAGTMQTGSTPTFFLLVETHEGRLLTIPADKARVDESAPFVAAS